MNGLQPNDIKIKESSFAKALNIFAWIPLIGLANFLLFAPFILWDLGKGKEGFSLLRKAFVKVFFLSILPIVLLILWGGLPENFYPDIIFGKHGVYYIRSKKQLEDHMFYFGKLTEKTSYYKNGNVKSISSFRENQHNGLSSWFHENGRKKFEIFYKLGLFHGSQTAWYDNGQKEFEGSYNDGRFIGKWQGWYKNGQQSWIAEYNDEGKQIGDYRVWHKNGKIALEGQFDNGQETGKWQCFYDSGNVEWETDDFSTSTYETISPMYQISDVSWTDETFIGLIDQLRMSYSSNVFLNSSDFNNVDNCFIHIKGLPLKYVEASSSNISDDDILFLTAFPIEILTFDNCDNISDVGLSYLSKFSLDKLNISWNDTITDQGLFNLRDTKLNTLNLTGCPNITYKGILYLQSIPLENLTLYACPNIFLVDRKDYDGSEEIRRLYEKIAK